MAQLIRASVRYTRVSSLVLVALYFFTFSTIATVLLRRHGFPLDDSYIHQTVARNLALHSNLGFDLHHRSSGATSVLWTLIQAANLRFFHLDPVDFNVFLSYILLASVGPLLFLMAVRDRMDPLVCWIVATAPAFLGNFLWLGMIGMEHLLFVVLSLTSIYLWLLPVRRSTLLAIFAGLTTGLLSVTRPEAIAFGPLLVLAAWLLAPVRRSWQDNTILVAIWSVFTGVMVSVNLWTSDAIMPATLHGRRWLYFHTSGGAYSFASKLRFAGAWVQRLPRQFSLRYTHQIVSVWDFHSLFAIIGLLLLGLITVGVVYIFRQAPLRIGLLCGWAALHFGLYFFTFPSGGHGGRYQPLMLLLLMPLLMLGIYDLFCRIFLAQQRITLLVVASSMLISGFSSLHTWRFVTYVGIGHIDATHGRIAQWMNANLPSSVTFAAFDIGRVSYDWKGDTIDLGGLVDPTYVHYLQTGRVGDYLQQRHIEYVQLPSTGTEDMGLSKVLGTKLVEFCSAPEDWLIGFRYTIHATPCQILFRLPVAGDIKAKVSALTPLAPVSVTAR